MLNDKRFKKRADMVVLSLALWAVICIIMFFYYAVIAKDKYIRLGNKLARRELLYYPERARILDKNGVILAWSEKYYDLYYNNLTGSPERIWTISEKVREILPDASRPQPEEVHSIMYSSLRPEQIILLEKLICLFQELQITPRIERKVVNYPAVRLLIGQVKLINGRLVGVSGLEKQGNAALSGAPGKYMIMLDRNKNWIKNSGQSLRLATPGRDIWLQLTIEEARKGQQ